MGNAADASWVEWVVTLLSIIYDVIEGDQARLAGQTTLDGKMQVVAEHYAEYGLPGDLTPEARDRLARAVHQLYGELADPPPDAPFHRRDGFLAVLKLIWIDMGLPTELLGATSP